jgi:4-amino-4-deoxy-L-arabinose transferase-like glycosyltransferase
MPMLTPLTTDSAIARRAWWLFAAAVASSVPTFGFYLVGEEGILVNSSLEMWQRGDWMRLWLYGTDAKHGVFANWLVILLSRLVGWEHAPAATRAIMIFSTAGSALLLAFLTFQLYKNAALAALAAAICVTFADILLYRGWLGYRDPLLAMLVFGAIASLWLAVAQRRAAWLAGTLLFTAAAFLTKGIIAYAFVGAAALVFLCRREARGFLLRPVPVFIAVVTLSVPFLWAQAAGGDQSHNSRLMAEIGDKLAPLGGWAYIKNVLSYPLETLLRLSPVSLLVLWWLYRRRAWRAWVAEQPVRTALIIFAVAYIPFWLAPQNHFRYVMPVLPLVALVLAAAVWQQGEAGVRVMLRWLWAAVAIKLVLAMVAFPIYQQKFRGENYSLTARAVLQRTAGFPLYSNDTTAAGLAVTAYLNILRLPQPALTFAPAAWDNGFVISYSPDAAELRSAKVVARYRLAGDTLYLYCRGKACSATAP